MSGFFISHAHSDEPLARALAHMIETLFGGKIPPVNYSSRKDLAGSIEPGEDWFRWIVGQVREADIAVILLTPNSVAKPWVLWEAGAVAGSAFSSDVGRTERRLYPLVYGLDGASIPGPVSRTQVVKAADREDILKFIESVYRVYESTFDAAEGRRFGTLQEAAVNTYLATVESVLPRLPIAVTEAAIQEWLDRLDKLVKEKRYSEAGVLEDWMDVSFGRDASDRKRPLDVRIHRRLAEIYSSAGQASDAERQYRLARQTAPRDILIMRGLGKALLDRGDLAGCHDVIEEIERLDPKAFEKNPENAAIKARWQRDSHNVNGAVETLSRAFRNFPTSYYLADILGQALLDVGNHDGAKKVYQQIKGVLVNHGEANIWAAGTTLTAAMALSDLPLADSALEKIEALHPSVEQRRSIAGGVARLKRSVDIPPELSERLAKYGWID